MQQSGRKVGAKVKERIGSSSVFIEACVFGGMLFCCRAVGGMWLGVGYCVVVAKAVQVVATAKYGTATFSLRRRSTVSSTRNQAI